MPGRTRQTFRPGLVAHALETRLAPAVFNVTNGADLGPGSLRQAMVQANASPGADTISFAGLPAPWLIGLTSGAITVTDTVAIDAGGGNTVTVAANGLSSIFVVNDSTANQIGVTFRNLVITQGFTSGNGGGINVSGNEIVNVLNCSIQMCQAGVYGGGMYVAPGGKLTVRESTVSGNYGISAGGGLYLYDATLDLVDSTIRDNLSTNGAGVTVARTLGLAPNWTITNSTISGNINQAGGPGGGILAYFDTGSLNIRNSTISNNKANPSGEVYVVPLPGNPTFGTISLESTIVGFSGSGTLQDINAPIVTAKTSWINSLTGIGLFTNGGGNLLFPVALAPLAANGGPTWTHNLLPGSPAINVGSNPLLLANDQRGTGFPRQVGAGPDIGAIEFTAAPPRVGVVTVNGGVAQRSMVTKIDVTFDQVVTLPAPATNAFNLTRQSDGAVVTLAATVGGPPTNTVVTLSFLGGPINSNSLADGRYTLTVIASQVTANGQNLDGNGDGVGGDSYVLVGTPANGLFRLFGDSDGSGQVDSVDFLAFRLAFLTASTVFDFDGSGQVDGADFLQFRLRFLMMI
ncbi:MAG: right-handed parallel beta-helix repeat-containing protein [Gemmataceae bacterium]|nr:right-handed parallel beta-helix repeat-containing protein [Gemmataceae bacterium]